MAEMRFRNGPVDIKVTDGVPTIERVLQSDELRIRRNGFVPVYHPECYEMTDGGLVYSNIAQKNMPFSMYRSLDDLYFGYDGWNGQIYVTFKGTNQGNDIKYDFVFNGAAGDLFSDLADVSAVKEMTKSISDPEVETFYVAVNKQNGIYHVTIGRKYGQADVERDIRAKNMKDFLNKIVELFQLVKERIERAFVR
jgi:hypothetical protein